jgi:Dolichyl-phosphate-mannose-protein mannosyltransferase
MPNRMFRQQQAQQTDADSGLSASLLAARYTAPLTVALLTAIGFAIRLANLHQGLFGDELSTAWIVHGRSLGRVVSLVYSDAEVTPPLSFVLAWASQHLGSSWEWLRLPSLIAGTATIPLVYGIGLRTAGRTAALLAAAICALSGVMILFSTEARNYSMLMACVAAATLSMLLALDTGRRWWWVAYAAASCLAMYSHYSAAFVLIAQLLWVLWTHAEARRYAILANLGAAAAYAPWIPGAIRDTKSVTIPIINALLPFTFSFVRRSVGEWAVGLPYTTVHQVPGTGFALAIGAGILLAGCAATARAWPGMRTGETLTARLRTVVSSRGFLLVLLAGSTLLGESLYSVLGGHILDSRNLNASWPGLAVSIGALISAAGPLLGTLSCLLVLSGFCATAVDSLKARWQRPNYPAVARYITQQARPGDAIVDASIVPVVPLTGLDAYLPQTHREFRLGLPEGQPPYTTSTRVPSATSLIFAAAQSSTRGRIFLIAGAIPGRGDLSAAIERLQQTSGAVQALRLLSQSHQAQRIRQFPGIQVLTVLTMTPRSGRRPPP